MKRTMVGIRDDLIKRVEQYRKSTEEQTGLTVTMTDAVRLLVLAGLAAEAQESQTPKPRRNGPRPLHRASLKAMEDLARPHPDSPATLKPARKS